MISALWFLQYQSVKNRLWQRVKRLRRPRYLFGALAGGAYLALMVGRTFLTLGRPVQRRPRVCCREWTKWGGNL